MDLARHVGFVKSTKEKLVREAGPGIQDDICPIVVFERDGIQVAVCHAPQVDRDLGLAIASIGAPGYGADEMLFAVDAHYTTQPLNPRTGKPWQPGEMQKACDHEGACDVGVTTDCLMVLTVNLAGEMRWMNVPYHVDKATRETHWLDTEFMPEDLQLAGLVPDTLRDAMKRDRLPLEAPDGGVTRAEADAFVTAALMSMTHAAVMLASPLSQEDMQGLAARFGGMVLTEDEFEAFRHRSSN